MWQIGPHTWVQYLLECSDIIVTHRREVSSLQIWIPLGGEFDLA